VDLHEIAEVTDRRHNDRPGSRDARRRAAPQADVSDPDGAGRALRGAEGFLGAHFERQPRQEAAGSQSALPPKGFRPLPPLTDGPDNPPGGLAPDALAAAPDAEDHLLRETQNRVDGGLKVQPVRLAPLQGDTVLERSARQCAKPQSHRVDAVADAHGGVEVRAEALAPQAAPELGVFAPAAVETFRLRKIPVCPAESGRLDFLKRLLEENVATACPVGGLGIVERPGQRSAAPRHAQADGPPHLRMPPPRIGKRPRRFDQPAHGVESGLGVAVDALEPVLGRRAIIVGEGDPVGAGLADGQVPRSRPSPLLRSVDGPDRQGSGRLGGAGGVRELGQDFPSRIGGAVVHDERFVGGPRLARQGLETAGQEFRAIVREDNDGNGWRHRRALFQ